MRIPPQPIPVENRLGVGAWEMWVNVCCYVIGEKKPPHPSPLPQVFCRIIRKKVMFFDGKNLGGEGAFALRGLEDGELPSNVKLFFLDDRSGEAARIETGNDGK